MLDVFDDYQRARPRHTLCHLCPLVTLPCQGSGRVLIPDAWRDVHTMEDIHMRTPEGRRMPHTDPARTSPTVVPHSDEAGLSQGSLTANGMETRDERPTQRAWD